MNYRKHYTTQNTLHQSKVLFNFSDFRHKKRKKFNWFQSNSLRHTQWRVFWGCIWLNYLIFFSAIPFSLFVTHFFFGWTNCSYYCQEVDLRFFWIMAVLLCIFYNNNNLTYQFYINIKYTYSIELKKKNEEFVENHMILRLIVVSAALQAIQTQFTQHFFSKSN